MNNEQKNITEEIKQTDNESLSAVDLRVRRMNAKEEALKIKFNSLTTRQAAKWFLLHERERHVDDIFEIDRDLKKLKDVELPSDILNSVNARFEV